MYVLDSTSIRRPNSIEEKSSTQLAQHRTLDGTISRDYFGDTKRVWVLSFANTNPTDYSTIKAKYDTYLSNGTTQTWEITETNYTVAETRVHLDLVERGFSVKGSDYISDFDLVLTEA